jgi:peptidoglycan-N-acetylglucosamine deacetylase
LISMFSIVTALSAVAAGSLIVISILVSCPAPLFAIIFIFLVHQAFYVYGMFSARTNFFFKTVKGREFFGNSPSVLLRFDDGPDPVYTPLILDILKEKNAHGLFAVMGNRSEQYPGIIERMHREGHIIANHTYSHPYNILLLGRGKIRDEISKTNAVIERITGQKTEYFCPPIGQKNPVIGKVIRELGMKPVMWDLKTLDTRLPADQIMRKIRKKLRPPAVILLHDGILPWSKKDREATVLAVKETLEYLELAKIPTH